MQLSVKKQNQYIQDKFYNEILQPMIVTTKHFLDLYSSIMEETQNAFSTYGKDVKIIDSLPNIAITTHNKISEIINCFQKANLYVFAKENEKTKVIDTDYVGQALLFDILQKAKDSTEYVNAFTHNVCETICKLYANEMMITKQGKVMQFIYGIKIAISRILTASKKRKALGEIIETSNSDLHRYEKANKEIANYSIRDNVVEAIVKKILLEHLKMEAVSELIQTEIEPDFEKLGIADLIPKLKERVMEAYKTDSEMDLESENMTEREKFAIQYRETLRKNEEEILEKMSNTPKCEKQKFKAKDD